MDRAYQQQSAGDFGKRTKVQENKERWACRCCTNYFEIAGSAAAGGNDRKVAGLVVSVSENPACAGFLVLFLRPKELGHLFFHCKITQYLILVGSIMGYIRFDQNFVVSFCGIKFPLPCKFEVVD